MTGRRCAGDASTRPGARSPGNPPPSPFQQTTDIVQRLRAKGDVAIELMIAPDEPHEFLLYANRMEAYERTFEFIDRHIGKKK